MNSTANIESEPKERSIQPILVPLLLAVVIHLLLLTTLLTLTPTRNVTPEPPTAATIVVQLRELPMPPSTQSEIAEAPPIEPTPAPPQLNEVRIEPKPTVVATVEAIEPKLDLDIVREQIRQQINRGIKPKKPAALGRFIAKELPENWTRKAVSYTPGMFKGAELPTRAIVLDRWRSPGGALSTRTKLPNGNIICSSREQHNPLDRYSSPIWMHRAC